ncbi:zinc knuckle CX2CX4HX4C containing protein [Tanacetum coccineum]
MKPLRCVNFVEAPMVFETIDATSADVGVTVHEVAASNLNEKNIYKPASNVGNENLGITSMAIVKVESPFPKSDFHDATKRDTNAPLSRLDSQRKIVKVSSLTNEEKVLGADVALPIAAVDEICDKFANMLYGYFIGSWLAFPIVHNYVRNAWAKYGLLFIIASFSSNFRHVKSTNTKLKMEDSIKVPVWIKVHNVPVVAFSEIGLSLITTQLGRPIMLDARTSDLCLNLWSRSTFARALIELSVERAIKDSVVVSIPFPNGSGHSLETLDVEYEALSVEGNMPYKRVLGGNQQTKVKQIHGIRFSKPRTIVIYRHVSKAHKVDAKDTPPPAKDDAQVVDKPCGSPAAAMDALPRDKGKSTFIQDDIDLGQIKKNMDRLMEEEKVLDINTNVGSAVENSVQNTNEASTSKSTSESDEFEVEEVCMPDGIPGGGFLDDLEDDLDCYDGYEAQVYDLTEQEQAICDRYDIRLHSRCRK